MGYVGSDFSPISEGEIEWLSIDFARILSTGETILSASATLSQTLPPSPALTVLSASINGTIVVTLVGPLVAGIYYQVKAQVITSLGQTLSAYSNIACQES